MGHLTGGKCAKDVASITRAHLRATVQNQLDGNTIEDGNDDESDEKGPVEGPGAPGAR